MSSHPGVDLVSLTGGLAGGTKVAAAAATVQKVALELGGKNPNVVFADACATDEGFDTAVAVIEGGPSDIGREDVLTLRRWLGLLGGDLDYDYPATEQPRGNSHIRHSRARVLGGCSSHNTLIPFKPLPSDTSSTTAPCQQGS